MNFYFIITFISLCLTMHLWPLLILLKTLHVWNMCSWRKMYITKYERAASFSWLTVLCWMQPKGSSSQDGNTGIYSSTASQRTTYRGGFLKKKLDFRCKTEGCLWSTLCTTFSGCCTSKPHDQLTEKPQVSKRTQQDECKEAEADTSLTPTASENDKNTERAQPLSFHTNRISVKHKKKEKTTTLDCFTAFTDDIRGHWRCEELL